MSSAEPESGDCSGQGSTMEGTKHLTQGRLSQRVFPLLILGSKTSRNVKLQGRLGFHMPNRNRVSRTMPYNGSW